MPCCKICAMDNKANIDPNLCHRNIKESTKYFMIQSFNLMTDFSKNRQVSSIKLLMDQIGHGAFCRSLSWVAVLKILILRGVTSGGLHVIPHEKICAFCPQYHLDGLEPTQILLLNFIYTGYLKDASF